MAPHRIGIIGPSDISSFTELGIATLNDTIKEIQQDCNIFLSRIIKPIVCVVPYKGIPVEAARIYGSLGGEVHGLYDDSLSKSGNFHANKEFCSKLLRCPDTMSIEDFLIDYVNALIVIGISYGTMKELLANMNIGKPAFVLRPFVSSFPVELCEPLKVVLIDHLSEIPDFE